jgi:hypothetical protein
LIELFVIPVAEIYISDLNPSVTVKSNKYVLKFDIIPNENICFPIGTILAVNKLYDTLDFSTVFGKHKKSLLNLTVTVDLVKPLAKIGKASHNC